MTTQEVVRQHYNASGSEKRAFLTQEGALSAAREYEAYWHQRLNVYQCKVCSRWHLGHKKRVTG